MICFKGNILPEIFPNNYLPTGELKKNKTNKQAFFDFIFRCTEHAFFIFDAIYMILTYKEQM